MAKVIFPLFNYREQYLDELISLFPQDKKPFISAIAVREESTNFSSDLKRKISSKRQELVLDKPSFTDQFLKYVRGKKLMHNVYTCSINKYAEFLQEQSEFADLVYFSPSEDPDNSLFLNLSNLKITIPFLLTFSSVTDSKTIVIPLEEGLDIQLVKKFIALFPFFLKSRKVIVLAPKPENEMEMRKEKYLVEFLRSNMPVVSFSWYSNKRVSKAIEENIASSDHPLLLITPLSKIYHFKEILSEKRVSIFAE